MIIKELKWDSNFFGYKVGRFNASNLLERDSSEILKIVKNHNFKLVYIFASNKEIVKDEEKEILKRKVNEIKAKLVDEKVVFSKFPTNYDNFSENIKPYYDTVENRETLYKLAILSGKYSRFKLDENFSYHQFVKMYKTWVDNSINQTFADKIFIYEKNDVLCGFVTIKKTSRNTANIGLIAVDEDYQGLNIGRNLIKHCEKYCIENNFKELTVPTQMQNMGAVKFYEKSGFSIKEIIQVYHLWSF